MRPGVRVLITCLCHGQYNFANESQQLWLPRELIALSVSSFRSTKHYYTECLQRIAAQNACNNCHDLLLYSSRSDISERGAFLVLCL